MMHEPVRPRAGKQVRPPTNLRATLYRARDGFQD
jgi:hypothetical protein